MQDIFISDYSESNDLSIVVEGDDHSIWAYILRAEGEEHKILLTGFVCSRGTVLDKMEEAEQFIQQNVSPPLVKEFANEHSVLDKLDMDDIIVLWNESEVRLMIGMEVYAILSFAEGKAYSKGLSRRGPYGSTLDEYQGEVM